MKILPRHCLLKFVIIFSILNFCLPIYASTKQFQSDAIQKKLAKLEAKSAIRLGVFAIDTANNRQIEYRAYERFPMGCTSKVMGVAAILKKSMTSANFLQKRITYHKKDIVAWAPITKEHLARGMTIDELCAAAISFSDNTAMNLLVNQLGGIQQINSYARSINDDSFKMDHDWPAEALSNSFDGNDSSTPSAMAISLRKIILSDGLARLQREKLQSWLISNTTGNARIRAGIPHGWIVGDKTGTGFFYGTANDLAIIWPPKCAPIILAIYTTSTKKNAAMRDDVIAAVTRLVVKDFSSSNQCIRL
jgi:beta-lactamase class A